MDSLVVNFYRCGRRVQEFLTAHPFADAPVDLGKQRVELDEVVGQLSQDAVEQEAGHRLTAAGNKNQRELRRDLWDNHMLPISRVGRDVFGIAGMDRALKLPKKSVTNEVVLAAAGAMAEAASKQEAALIEHGLSKDFVAELRAASAALATALGNRDGTMRRRVTATAGMSDQVKRGRRALRLLNAILAPKLATDPELLAAWNNVRRVKPSAAAPKAPATPAPATPAPAELPAAAKVA